MSAYYGTPEGIEVAHVHRHTVAERCQPTDDPNLIVGKYDGDRDFVPTQASCRFKLRHRPEDCPMCNPKAKTILDPEAAARLAQFNTEGE